MNLELNFDCTQFLTFDSTYSEYKIENYYIRLKK